MRRAVGAGVDVDQLVARMSGKIAAFLLERAIAGGADPPAGGEFRHRSLEKLAHPRRVGAEDLPHARGRSLGRLQARDAIGIGIVADVLSLQMRGQPVAEEFLLGGGRQVDGAAGKLHDPSTLELFRAILAGCCLVKHRMADLSMPAREQNWFRWLNHSSVAGDAVLLLVNALSEA